MNSRVSHPMRAVLALGDSQGHEKVDRRERVTTEAAGRDTNDRVVFAIDDPMLSEDGGASTEPALPIRMAQHGNGAARRRCIVLRSEESPQRWMHAEDAEVIARRGDHRRLGNLGATSCR